MHNLLAKEQEVLRKGLTLTAASQTLTGNQVKTYGVIVANRGSSITITLPAAGSQYAGLRRAVVNMGAGDLSVAVAAGFGGSAKTSVTLGQGDLCIVYCDGNYWYAESVSDISTLAAHVHTFTAAELGTHQHAAISGGTPAGTNGAEAAHTHAVALDGGASGAGATHTHAFAGAALDTHQHAAITAGTPAGTNANEEAHTHAVALDGGVSAAGDSHNHAFTGGAIATDTFTVAHDATPETSVVYVSFGDGVVGTLNADNSVDNADDYVETAGGERVLVLDNNGSPSGLPVYFDEDAAAADSRLLINNTIMGKDMFVKTSGGKLVRLKHDAGAAATGVPLYFNDDGGDATLRLNGTLPGTANITTNATDDTWRGMTPICAGSNAAESTHTHAPGTLADAASGAGSAHTHVLSGAELATHQHAAITAGTPAGTNANESTHTHGPGTLADAASGVGSSHNHAFTGGALGTHQHAAITAGTPAGTTDSTGS